MSSQKKSTAVFVVFFVAAVIFFIAIIVLATVQDSGESAKVIDTGMTVTEMRVDTVWNKDRSCKITQELDVEFLDTRHGIYVDIPVNSGERVRGMTVSVRDSSGESVPYELMHESLNKIVRVKIGDPYSYFLKGDRMYCVLNYEYITPTHTDGENLLDINPVGYGWACSIQKAKVSVTFPRAVTADTVQVWVSGKAERNIELSEGGRKLTLETGKLSPFQGVRVKAEMPKGVLTGSGFEGIITVVIGIMLVSAVVLLMLFCGRDKPLTPVINFYPPMTDGKRGRKRRMLPVQVGKIIDGVCSSTDVTSLIFYWASEGYIAIEEKNDEIYFIKLKDVDPVTEYERTLFNALFKKAKKDKNSGELRVCVDDLSGKFADSITAAKLAVNKEFGGGFYKSGYTALSVMFAALTAVYAVLTAVLVTLRISSGFFNFIGLVVVIPVIVSYVLGTMIVKTYFKLPDVKRNVYLALYLAAALLMSIAVMFAVPTDCMGWTEKVVFALCIGAASAVTPFLTRRTDEYTELLNDVTGFRNFLRDAEKDRLETLLADDPQYYYDILPYANVLGVSKIWQDKFAALDIEPPQYYRGGDDVTLFDFYVISRLTYSVGRSLSYVPPKANSGSFSGGGGGGGGFGGGGGGSW